MIAGLRAIGKELAGLFVEDGLFALAIVLWLLVAAALMYFHIGTPVLDALAIMAGLSVILIASVYRGAAP